MLKKKKTKNKTQFFSFSFSSIPFYAFVFFQYFDGLKHLLTATRKNIGWKIWRAILTQTSTGVKSLYLYAHTLSFPGCSESCLAIAEILG